MNNEDFERSGWEYACKECAFKMENISINFARRLFLKHTKIEPTHSIEVIRRYKGGEK